jgi:hypothetical protein
MSGCIDFTATQMNHFIGGTLYRIDVALPPEESVLRWTSCKIWIKSSLSGAIQYEQQLLEPEFESWNEITLTTPQTIIAGPFVIGYTLTVEAEYSTIHPFWSSSNENDVYRPGGFNYIMSVSAASHGIGANFFQYTTQGNLGIIGYVSGIQPPATNDLAATLVTSNVWPKVLGNPYSYTVSVFNAGETAQNNYTVQLIDDSDNILASLMVPDYLEPGATAAIDLTYSAHASGNLTVRGKVILADDAEPDNDISAPNTFYVYPMEPMRYCTRDEALNGFGIGNFATLSGAISYPAANMGAYAGNLLTTIEFGLCEDPSMIFYSIVWIRNSLTGANLYYQYPTTLVQGWNTIVLNTPFELSNEDIVIGYTINTTGGYPIGTTSNTQNAAHGGHIATSPTAWWTLAGQGYSGNVAIIGTVEYPPQAPCASVTDLSRLTIFSIVKQFCHGHPPPVVIFRTAFIETVYP